jgi:chromosome segregation ATPase
MTSDNQALLEAFRGMLDEAIAPLATRMDRLETRMEQLDARAGRLESRIEQLEERVDTIDTRTGQIASDLLYLRDRVPLLEERIDNGLRALKSDLGLAFNDMRKISAAQERSDRALDGMKRELAGVQQRMAALEGMRGAS